MTRWPAAAAVLAVLLPAGPAGAGHGMSSSFATIEWLPEPGRTPDQLLYFLDAWSEARALAAARSPRETVEASLRIAREKLAELEAMVQAKNGSAAKIAADRYRVLVGRAEDAARAAPGADAQTLARTLCQALLEHQYILSVDYETLPSPERAVLADVTVIADAAYQAAAARLARQDREPLRFKENEVRWSVRAGMATDGEKVSPPKDSLTPPFPPQ